LAGERLGLRLDSYPGHAGIIARTRHVTTPGLRHVARFWGHRGSFYDDDEPVTDFIGTFTEGKRVVTGPSVDDYKDMGQQITDEINADPEEVEQLHRARVQARAGDRTRLGDLDFFEEDEPIEDVKAAWDATEKHLTEPPATGTGWCAPSP
jgi:hypothetical protein